MIDDAKGAALWFIRILLMGAGNWLTARGYMDDAMWQQISGAVITLAGAVWSWRARQAAIAMEPPRR